MQPLLIRVKHSETGTSDQAGFKRSPVRIGRNALNDLAIDEAFVSQWHAVVRFDADGTRYIDLGSTNGTEHRGERLEKNTELTVGPDTELTIGPLTLTFARQTLDATQVAGRRRSAFKLSSAASHGDQRTVALGKGGPAAILPPGAAAAPPAKVAPEAVAATEAMAAPSMLPMQLVNKLTPHYGAYRSAWAATFDELSAALVNAQPAERDGLVTMLRLQFPDVLHEPRCQRMLSELAVDPTLSGAVDAAAWVGRLTDRASTGRTSMPPADDPAASMERAGALLESFAESYCALRKAHDELSGQLSLEASGAGGELDGIREPRKLLGWLMDPKADGEERVRELRRAFADLAVHPVAMVSGATEGARAVLMLLSPHVLGGGGGALARTSPGFGDLLFPWGAMKSWYRYVGAFADQIGGERFTQTLFGKAFDRMYRRVAGRAG